MITYLFHGQGIQKKGMGKELFSVFKRETEIASQILGYSLETLCLYDKEHLLNQTRYAQPAIFVLNALEYKKKMRETNRIPDMVVGHSLGEYNALLAADVFDFETGLQIVAKRGQLMGEMAEGKMAAITGLSASRVVEIIKQYELYDIDIANYNSPLQTVISGPDSSIKSIEHIVKQEGAKGYIILNVSGPFHSRYYKKASILFEEFLSDIKLKEPKIPVISNVYALPYDRRRLKQTMSEQLRSPVKWVESIQYIVRQRDMEIEEIGNPKILSKFSESIQSDLEEKMSENRTWKAFEHAIRQVHKEKYLSMKLDDKHWVSVSGEQLLRNIYSLGRKLLTLTAQSKVILFLPQSIDIINSLFSCIYANVVAVFIPVVDLASIENEEEKIHKIIEDSGASALITLTKYMDIVNSYSELSKLQSILIDEKEEESISKPRKILETDLSVLLYTSGSTSDPKGVMLTHKNLLIHAQNGIQITKLEERSRILTWMPQFHSFGLIFEILAPILARSVVYICKPNSFIENPLGWFRDLSELSITHSATPNFGLSYCVKQIEDRQLNNISLERLECILCGGEMVHKETYESFMRICRNTGLKKNVVRALYGMSEVGFITGSSEEGIHFLSVDKTLLEQSKLKEVNAEDADKWITSCGRIMDSFDIRIIYPETGLVCKPDEIGEVWVRSDAVGLGYYRKNESSKYAFHAKCSLDGQEYFNTGDMGVVKENELYLTGRIKEAMIVNGKKYYPSDIELTLAKSIKDNKFDRVVFSVEEGSGEKIIVVQETEDCEKRQLEQLTSDMIRAVSKEYSLEIAEVLIVPKNTIKKTSTGKAQRQKCKLEYLRKSLNPIFAFRWNEQEDNQTKAVFENNDNISAEQWIKKFVSSERRIPAERIDLEKSIQEYGLNSIAMIRFISVMKKQYGYELALSEIFECHTINELAHFIHSKASEKCVDAEMAGTILKDSLEQNKATYIPLSLGQKGLWMQQKVNPKSYAYNVPICLKLGSRIDLEGFKQAVRAMLAYNPILNSKIEERGEIYAHLLYDVSAMFEDAVVNVRMSEIDSYLRKFMQEPFHMGKDQVMRIRFITTDMGERYFAASIHHIVVDGYSIEIILYTIWKFYQSIQTGIEIAAEYNLQPYFQCVLKENNLIQSTQGDPYRAYWKKKFSRKVPQLNCEARNNGSGDVHQEKKMETMELDSDIIGEIRSFGVENRINLSTIFLLAYEILLYQITGRKENISEIPVMRRVSMDYAQLVGYFINIIPVRFHIDFSKTVIDELCALQQLLLTDIDYAAYPYPAIVKEVRRENGQLADMNMRVSFAYQNFYENWNGAAPDWESQEQMYFQKGDLDFFMEICEHQNSIIVHLKYDTKYFNITDIKNILKDYHQILDKIGKGMEMKELLINKVIDIPNSTSRMEDKTICHLLREQAENNPNQTAVVCMKQILTYGELEKRSNILAVYLQKHGVKAGDVIGLYMKKSINSIVGILGILKAKGVYLPLDVGYPVSRVKYMLHDSNARFILTDQESYRNTADIQDKEQEIFTIEEAIRCESLDVIDFLPANSHLAYIIYTSGSSGKPKGTMLEHRGINSLVQYFDKSNLIRKTDRVTQFYSMSFDASINEIFSTLAIGAQLHILTTEYTHDVKEYTKYCNDNRITVAFLPVSFLAIMHPSKLETVQTILTGGSEISVSLLWKWNYKFNYVNLYGPTEDTVISTAWLCLRGSLQDDMDAIPIGTSLPGKFAYILDENKNELPSGEKGEIYLGGIGLARGYLNMKELTAQRFLQVEGFECERLYHTGDIGYKGKDGNLYYVGRMDMQVKYHGYRIEIEEIEKRIKNNPYIQDCAVIFSKRNGLERLIAYYVTNHENEMNHLYGNEQLKQWLEDKLPHYMMPSFFIQIEQMPMTLNAKIDRDRLDKMELENLTGKNVKQPENQLEKSLLEIWKSVLNLTEISTDSLFFEAGGDSILAVILAEKIEALFNLEINVTDIFQYPSIQKFSMFLEQLLEKQRENESTTKRKQNLEVTENTMNADTLPDYYEDSIAIIGMSLKLPGAVNYEEFWDNLRNGRESVRHLLPEELRKLGVPEDKIANPDFVPVLATIDYENCLDGNVFKLSPADIERMSAEFQLLLAHSLFAVRDSGYDISEVSETGVFVTTSNLGALKDENSFSGKAYQKPGSIATMISYKLGFTGGSLYLQSNCSSSLAALHMACQSLRKKESKYAIVGGASISNQQVGYLYRKGMTSSKSGHVKAFAADADGMVGGDGIVVFMLKRALDAKIDGDRVYAIIRGSAINNDGSDKVGFFAPSVNGQKRVIMDALNRTGINAESIQYVEAHGTGTTMGDPIEAEALIEAYRSFTEKEHFCGIGSVKSNIGHLDSASGLAGCAKVILSLLHREIPPSINIHELNPKIKLQHSPFYIVQKLQSWKTTYGIRRAGVSSFGIGGTNVHVLLEEYLGNEKVKKCKSIPNELFLIPVSADTIEDLRNQLRRILEYLTTYEEEIHLKDFAYTMQMEANSKKERVIFRPETIKELMEQINQYLNR